MTKSDERRRLWLATTVLPLSALALYMGLPSSASSAVRSGSYFCERGIYEFGCLQHDLDGYYCENPTDGYRWCCWDNLEQTVYWTTECSELPPYFSECCDGYPWR